MKLKLRNIVLIFYAEIISVTSSLGLLNSVFIPLGTTLFIMLFIGSLPIFFNKKLGNKKVEV